MRTTLTLEDDVARELERACRARDEALKVVVNEALRIGLRSMSAPRKRGQPYRTRSVSLGACRMDNVDNIAEALAIGEQEAYR
jgi:hypothetical protein